MADKEGEQTEFGLPIGSKIGKYEIRQKLDVGGQATVYKCHDEMLDRYVAIKQISPALAEDPKFVERFRREAQILARLGAEQPAVITIHELVQEPKGLFIVMEFVEGHTLETVLQDTPGPVEIKAALQIIWRLAAGLNAVHAAGIIHRDIKPSNILVAEGLKVKITDFGVAASMTGQTSMLLGTTKYMAPELFEGVQADGRADIYSLGFIAYEMLAGRPKFNEIFADVVRDRHSESLRWMKWHGNPKVTAPPLHEVNPAVPEALSEIVAKMIAKDPDERFESMEALGRAIRQSFSSRGKGVSGGGAPGPWRRQPAPKPGLTEPPDSDQLTHDGADDLDVALVAPPTAALPKKSLSTRTKIILSAIIVVSVVGIGVILGYRWQQAKWRVQASAGEVYSTAVKAYEHGEYADAAKKFAQLRKDFPGTRQAVQASVMERLALAHKAVLDADWSAAKSAEDAAASLVKKIQSRYDSLDEWTRRRGEEIREFGQYRISTRIFVEAIAGARQAADRGQFDQARALLNRRLSGISPTESQEAERLALLKKLDRDELSARLESFLTAGAELAGQGQYDQAVATFGQGLQELRSGAADILPDEHAKRYKKRLQDALAKTRNDKAFRQAQREARQARADGDMAAELNALQKLLRIRPTDADKARVKELRSALALTAGRKLLAEGKTAEARAKFDEALKIDPDNAQAKAELKKMDDSTKWDQAVRQAKAAFDSGRFAEALKMYSEAASIRADADVDARIAECGFRILLGQADGLRDAKKYDEALATYEKARGKRPAEAALIDARQADVRVRQEHDRLIAAGDAAAKQGKWSAALEYFRKARLVRPTPQADQRIANARYNENLAKGKASMSAKDLPGARAYFNIAKGFLDTKEVNDLIAEVEKKLDEEQPK